MLIIKEENKKLKGTKYRLPKEIFDRYIKILIKYPSYSNYSGYKRAKNVIKQNGVITMEWLKNMKVFFSKHDNQSDMEFILAGGYLVKKYVEDKLEMLTSKYGRAEHTNSATKIRNNSSNLSGNRGEKQSKTISIVNDLLSGLVPKFESKSISKNGNVYIINEEQFKTLKEYANKFRS